MFRIETVLLQVFFCPNLKRAFFFQFEHLTVFAVGVQKNIFHPLKTGRYLQRTFGISCAKIANPFLYHQLAQFFASVINENGCTVLSFANIV